MPRAHPVPHGNFVDLGLFEIPGIGPGRRVRAYLPHGHRHDRPRTSLFLFDGQNVFGDEGSFAGGWHVHEAIDRFEVRRRAPIVVAIDHGGPHRLDELTPFVDRGRGGKLDLLLEWIARDLRPLAVRSLAIDPQVAAIGGSSLGGLAAFYAHLRRPEIFSRALVMSPSFWFARRAIFDWVARRPIPESSRIYLDAGAREGRGMMLQHAQAMAEQLAARGHRDLLFRADPKGGHSEADWRRRLPKALRFLLG
jgi:predicted alpha/beta superfamily hydrolase